MLAIPSANITISSIWSTSNSPSLSSIFSSLYDSAENFPESSGLFYFYSLSMGSFLSTATVFNNYWWLSIFSIMFPSKDECFWNGISLKLVSSIISSLIYFVTFFLPSSDILKDESSSSIIFDRLSLTLDLMLCLSFLRSGDEN